MNSLGNYFLLINVLRYRGKQSRGKEIEGGGRVTRSWLTNDSPRLSHTQSSSSSDSSFYFKTKHSLSLRVLLPKTVSQRDNDGIKA